MERMNVYFFGTKKIDLESALYFYGTFVVTILLIAFVACQIY